MPQGVEIDYIGLQGRGKGEIGPQAHARDHADDAKGPNGARRQHGDPDEGHACGDHGPTPGAVLADARTEPAPGRDRKHSGQEINQNENAALGFVGATFVTLWLLRADGRAFLARPDLLAEGHAVAVDIAHRHLAYAVGEVLRRDLDRAIARRQLVVQCIDAATVTTD